MHKHLFRAHELRLHMIAKLKFTKENVDNFSYLKKDSSQF
jgi:hypothetical protein